MTADMSWLPSTVSPWSFYIVGALGIALVGMTFIVPIAIKNRFERWLPYYQNYVYAAMLVVMMGIAWAIEICLLWMGVQL